MSQSPAKTCVRCHRDVTHEKRSKDLQGRYYCDPCAQELRAPRKQLPDLNPPDQESYQSLEFKDPPPTPPPVARPTSPAARPPPALTRTPLTAGTGLTCPCCHDQLGYAEKICIGCGIQVPSGRPVITSLGRDTDTLYNNAEHIIRWLSWLVWLGIYPIASEAYAIKKPIVIWVVAAVTTLTSLSFFIAYQSDPESQTLNQLMLWPKAHAITDNQVLAIFNRIKDPKLRHAIQDLADDSDAPWSDDAPQERLIAACRYVGIGTVHGDFRWYQLLTNVFLHDPDSIGGFLTHLIGNMLFLLIFGTRVNALIGNLKMALLYPLLGILASTAHLLFTQSDFPTPALGASGAIMGLAGMYLIFFPAHKVYMAFWLRLWWFTPAMIKIWAMRGFWVLGFYLAFDIVATLTSSSDGVAHWAHLGGFFTGATIAIIMLVSRLQDARHADLLSVMLGKSAWSLIGRPTTMRKSVVVG